MDAEITGRRLMSGFAIALAGSACNELASIERGVLVDDGQGGGSLDGVGGGSVPAVDLTAGSSPAARDTGMGADSPPDVIIDPTPLTFSGRTVSHAGGLFEGRLETILGRDSTITPDCTDTTCFSEQTGSEVCVSGNTAAVLNGDFGLYWGAQLHIQLEDNASIPARPKWDRADGRVRGLSFVITGGRENMSFDVGTPGSPEEGFYAKYAVMLPVGSGVQHDILFESLIKPLWNPAIATPLPDDLPFGDISWTVGVVGDEAAAFDFCVSELRLILAVE